MSSLPISEKTIASYLLGLLSQQESCEVLNALATQPQVRKWFHEYRDLLSDNQLQKIDQSSTGSFVRTRNPWDQAVAIWCDLYREVTDELDLEQLMVINRWDWQKLPLIQPSIGLAAAETEERKTLPQERVRPSKTFGKLDLSYGKLDFENGYFTFHRGTDDASMSTVLVRAIHKKTKTISPEVEINIGSDGKGVCDLAVLVQGVENKDDIEIQYRLFVNDASS